MQEVIEDHEAVECAEAELTSEEKIQLEKISDEENHYMHVTRKSFLDKLMSDEEMKDALVSLNAQQLSFVYHVLRHVREKAEPLRLFLTGGAGVGKSTTINAVYEMCFRFFPFNNDGLVFEKSPCVLKLAPTGVAAFNIGGYTFHNALRLKLRRSARTYPPLGDESRHQLIVNFQNVQMLIVDEVSMAGLETLYYVNELLKILKN